MHLSGQQTAAECRSDVYRFRRLILWHAGAFALLIAALVLARYAPGYWAMLSWIVGVGSLIVTGKSAFDFGLGAPRK